MPPDFGKETLMKSRSERLLYMTLLSLAGLVFSAGPAAAAEGGSGGWGGVVLTIGRLFNLALVIVVLVWMARKPLAGFYASRTAGIREQLEEAQAARAEAEAKLAEVEGRMARLDEELRQIKETAEREGQDEYRRLAAAAAADAEKIVERARQEIEGMTRAAHIELKAHAAELAVRLAEKRIRRDITDEDRARLFERFVTRVGGGE
jgi:F-type H+-transporting ATPase subunit b